MGNYAYTSGSGNLSLAGPAGIYKASAGIHEFSYNGSTVVRGFDNTFLNVAGDPYNCSNYLDNQACTGNMNVSGSLTVGALSGNTYNWPGMIGEVLVWNAALTYEQRRAVRDYLLAKWGFVTKNVVMFGDSLVSGVGSTSGATQDVSITGDNLPGQLWASLGSTYTLRTDAYPGRSVQQLLAQCPNYGIEMYRPLSATKNIAVVFGEPTNTLATYQSAQLAITSYVDFCLLLKTMGFKVVISTAIARAGGVYTGFAADALIFNNYLRANWRNFADGFADVGGDSRMQTPTNETYFYTDGIHLNSVGYGVANSILYPVVAAM
jgi:hypothetical protein